MLSLFVQSSLSITKIHLMPSLLFLLVSLMEIDRSISSIPPSQQPFNPKNIQRFVSNRCNGLMHNAFSNDEVRSATAEDSWSISEARDKNPASITLPKEKQYSKGFGTWIYEGQLVNPFTGEHICEVEGIELTRHLSDIENSPLKRKSHPAQFQRMLDRLDDLQVRNMLAKNIPSRDGASVEQNKADEWDYASTFLSRKLFCYRDPRSRLQLLSKFQRTPGVGKTRQLTTNEAVALYDTATTYIVRNEGKEMVVVTEFPNRKCVVAQAQGRPVFQTEEREKTIAERSASLNSFEFTTYGTLKSGKGTDKKNKVVTLPPLHHPEKHENLPTTSKQVKPSRTTWVQFGPDSRDLQNERYGARESYSCYNMDPFKSSTEGTSKAANSNYHSSSNPFSSSFSKVKQAFSNLQMQLGFGEHQTKRKKTKCSSSPTVKYTRYGECPPWYGPNQMCALELVGRRVESLRDAPPLVASIASHAVPGFAAVRGPIPLSEKVLCKLTRTGVSLRDPNAEKALRWFRQNKLKFDEEYVPFGMPGLRSNTLLAKFREPVARAYDKLRLATTNSIGNSDEESKPN
jgi:hypothetical protein